MNTKPYPSDLTDRQWAILAPLIPPARPGGAPRQVDIRSVVNAILYVLRTGCQWRAMPHDYPHWFTCYTYHRRWQQDDTWEAINDALRVRLREQAGRNPEPSAAVIDSQSVKTTEKRGSVGMMLARRSRDANATSW